VKIKLGVILPVFKAAAGLENLLDHFNDLPGGDRTRVGDIINPKGRLFFQRSRQARTKSSRCESEFTPSKTLA